jgi:hypothetical protein
MIISLFQGAVSWFVGLTEAAVVIAVMLLIGLVVGMTAFWLLGRGLSKLAGPPAELDPYEDEPEEMAGAGVVSICPDEDSPPSKLGP